MFPRIVNSKRKYGTYQYLVLSESIRIKGKGSTTRNIANLGNIKKLCKNDINNLIDGLIAPQFKHAIKMLAFDVAISIAKYTKKSLEIFKQVLNDIKRVKYYRPKKKRKSYPRITKKAASQFIKKRAILSKGTF